MKNKFQISLGIIGILILLLSFFINPVSALTHQNTYTIPVNEDNPAIVGINIEYEPFASLKNYTVDYYNNYSLSNLTDKYVRTCMLTETRFISVFKNTTNRLLGVVGNIGTDNSITFGTPIELAIGGIDFLFYEVITVNETWALLQFKHYIQPEIWNIHRVLYVTGTDTLNLGQQYYWIQDGIALSLTLYHNCLTMTNTDNKDDVFHFETAFRLNFGVTISIRCVSGFIEPDKTIHYAGTLYSAYNGISQPYSLKCLDIISDTKWNVSLFFNVTNTGAYCKTYLVNYPAHTFYTNSFVDKYTTNGTMDLINTNKSILFYYNQSTDLCSYRIANKENTTWTFSTVNIMPGTYHSDLSTTVLNEHQSILSIGKYSPLSTYGYAYYCYTDSSDKMFLSRRYLVNDSLCSWLQTIRINDTRFLNGYTCNTPNYKVGEISQYLLIKLYSNSSGSWQLFNYSHIYSNGTYFYTGDNFTVNYTWYYWNYSIIGEKTLLNQSRILFFYTTNYTGINTDDWLYLGAMLELDYTQFFLALLIGLWIFFISKYYDNRTKHSSQMFAYAQIGIAIPLTLMLSSIAFFMNIPFITFFFILIPIFSLYIMADSLYYRKKQ